MWQNAEGGTMQRSAGAYQVFEYELEEWGLPGGPSFRRSVVAEGLGDIMRGIMRAHAPSGVGVFGSPGFGFSYLLWPFYRYGGLLDASCPDLRLRVLAQQLDPRKKAVVSEDLALGLTYRAMERRGVRVAVTKSELQSQTAQAYLASQSSLSVQAIQRVASAVSAGMSGADFIGLPATGSPWTVAEAKGHTQTDRVRPHGEDAIRRAKASPRPGNRGLRGAIAQVSATAAEVQRGGGQTEAYVGACWVGVENPPTRTVVQLVDPRVDVEATDDERAEFLNVLRVAAPIFHYRWIADLLEPSLSWGSAVPQSIETRRMVLGDEVVDAVFVREARVVMGPDEGLLVTFGLDRRALRAIEAGSLAGLDDLPRHLPPGLGADGLIVDVSRGG